MAYVATWWVHKIVILDFLGLVCEWTMVKTLSYNLPEQLFVFLSTNDCVSLHVQGRYFQLL